MQYKALILDVDGTLVPNRKDGMPSKRVTQAINLASKKLHIGIATGRPIFLIKHICEHLNLSGPSIVNGGAQLYDITHDKILEELPIQTSDIKEIVRIVRRHRVTLRMDNDNQSLEIAPHRIPEAALSFYITELTQKKADEIVDALTHLPTITAYQVPDWTPGRKCIHITHVTATKQHGILEIAKLLKIKTREIIGIGDGSNDFPLLMACGLKVAMGNAGEDLKAIADYIAPTVQDDGVAHVIEKFVLGKH